MRYVLLSFLLLACGGNSSPTASTNSASSCKGIYYTHDSEGNLQKWNSFQPKNDTECLTEPVALSNWEQTSQKFVKNQVQCTPQPNFPSVTLVSSNNFYFYSNGRILLDLDSSTGIYRRLQLGQDKDQTNAFSRSEGCFYTKTGTGVDASFGLQLLLDVQVDKWASSDESGSLEIFSYTSSGINVSMSRFDETQTWDWSFCPDLVTPSAFCSDLRNGNIMYYPTLTVLQETALLNQAVMIRSKFNYTTAPKSFFETNWSTADQNAKELDSGAFLYTVVPNPDAPPYIWQAWYGFVVGTVDHMPDVTSSQTQTICWSGSQDVTLAGGTTGKVYGQICYDGTTYTFTQ